MHGDIRAVQSQLSRCDCNACTQTKAFLNFRDLAIAPEPPATIGTRREAAAVMRSVAYEIVQMVEQVE